MEKHLGSDSCQITIHSYAGSKKPHEFPMPVDLRRIQECSTTSPMLHWPWHQALAEGLLIEQSKRHMHLQRQWKACPKDPMASLTWVVQGLWKAGILPPTTCLPPWRVEWMETQSWMLCVGRWGQRHWWQPPWRREWQRKVWTWCECVIYIQCGTCWKEWKKLWDVQELENFCNFNLNIDMRSKYKSIYHYWLQQ